jgi:hypothetical protein
MTKKKCTPKTSQTKSSKRHSIGDTMLKAIDAGIDPFDILPTGYLTFDNPKLKKHYKQWRIGADVNDLFHIFSLLARNHTIAEIAEEFVLFYLDWNKIREIGAKQAAKSRIELMNLKAEFKALKDGGDLNLKKALLLKIESFVEVHSADYGRELVAWLRRAVKNAIQNHHEKWETWMAEEHYLWLTDKKQSAPAAEKLYRVTMLNRLLEYEWSQKQKNSKEIREILKAIKDEVEGNVVTVQWNIEDIADSMMRGAISREDMLEIIGVTQRMLIAAVQGQTVEDMRRLVTGSHGKDLVIEAEEYLKKNGL